MIKVRKAHDRGHANHGWLDTYHSFSFADYWDPRFMGFRNLRVINEDFIEADQGFPTHGHRDMEIVTYVVQGEVSHKDSMGNTERIKRNEIQAMTAGTGVLHSEYSSPTEQTHMLQIWIMPDERNLKPSYDQKYFSPEDKQGKLRLLASKGGDDGSVHINQDVKLYASLLDAGKQVSLELPEGRHAWIQVITGGLDVNGYSLSKGDGAAISEETALKLAATDDGTEFLLFDLN